MDKAEKIDNIKWNVYGKIEEIEKTATEQNPVTNITYTYDANGNRISKAVTKAGTSNLDYTWYVRDASGNVMAIYNAASASGGAGALKLAEQHLYGSSRLGILNRDLPIADPAIAATNVNLLGDTYLNTFERGKKLFELSNHLGNVLVTISDKKLLVQYGEGEQRNGGCDIGTAIDELSVDARGTGNAFIARESIVLLPGFENNYADSYTVQVDNTLQDCEPQSSPEGGEYYYLADVVSTNDYYPFGMMMPGRKYAATSSYRYGFNGQEKSTEIDPNGNSMTAEFWQYDAKLGRRWNVDPVFKEFESPYASFGNNPVWLRDPNGADTVPTNSTNAVELRKQLRSKNVSAWSDLLNNKVSKNLIGGSSKSRDLEAAKIQGIENASNDPTNVDMYSITIDKLPNGVNSATELLEFVRKNFAEVMPGDVEFSGFSSDQRKIWDSKDPTGAVMSFDKNFALGGVIGDDASVLTSKYYTDDKLAYWNFTTLNTVWGDFGHPVSGTRQFGVLESKFKSASRYTFFIRGIDRVADNITKLGGILSSEYVFKQAHNTWITVMDKTSTLINQNGGQVTWSTHVSQRVSWKTDVKPLFQPSAPAAK